MYHLLKSIITASILSLNTGVIAKEAPLPNIVFIIADDLGYGDLSCYGQKNFPTRHIDKLAGNGIRFTRHYSGSTVCAPSRCSLMTGRDTGHSTVRGNGRNTINDDEVTVAELVKSVGYNTAMIGKSCVTGNTQTPEKVLASGFDYFYGTTDHRDGHFRYPKFVYKNTKRIKFPDNKLHEGTHYDGHLYTKEALNYITKQSSETPFFLILSYPIPHASVLAPEADRAEVRHLVKEEVVYKKSRHYSNTTEVLANYISMITIMDKGVGSIVDQLTKQDLLEDTLIIFTSDNGPAFVGGKKPDMLNSSGPLRGGKRDLYEGGVRVPFIASWPGGIAKGQTTDHASAFWDFLPTVCELTGQVNPDDIQGVSYAATLLGHENQAKHKYLYWEYLNSKGGLRALQQGDWKVVQCDVNKSKRGVELYNIAKDMGERNDLSKSHPEKLSELFKLMENARVVSPLFPNEVLDQ